MVLVTRQARISPLQRYWGNGEIVDKFQLQTAHQW
ncbi:Uncharacterised protein [Salmonella enterica subsp. arizonae]|uniref:Uncharacterized protein n=1 Tax=Salmonella enterica subsp. arizonae TaxID=59203 RepID=A0A379THT6_SALER|nr:Uncharacterised protein [Salmonella enterica subsp. arizonae]